MNTHQSHQSHEPHQSSRDFFRHPGTYALIAAILGSGMAFIDGTVVNVATTTLQRAFGATAGEVQWVVEAYALTLSAFLLVGGKLGDTYGQKRIFMWGSGLFGVSSVLCGVTDSLLSLVLARALQGLAAALLIPGSLALITSAYAPAERGRAIGIWSGVTAMMGAVGPFLGGWLIDHLSWRAAFLINLPMAALAVYFAWRLKANQNSANRQSLNWTGAVSMAVVLAALTYALMSAQSRTLYMVPAAVVAIVFFLIFRFSERRAATPLFPAALLQSPVFVAVNAITLFLYAALWGAMYFLPMNLIQIHHYTASQAGAALAPMILTLFVLSPWTGGLLARFGARRSLAVGSCIVAAGLIGIAMPGLNGSYWSTFFVPMLILGLGMSVCVSPLTTTVMSSAPADQLGIASGINNAVSRVAGLLAVALFGLILSLSFAHHLDTMLHTLNLTDAARAETDRLKPLLAAAQYASPVIQHAAESSFVASFRVVIACSTLLALTSAACAWWMLKEERA
ncbi:MFS transporter [Paraburkholderia sp. DHOC27]|uniref:MFS transporter n=1 Tax=Paraburkholderia sp. DHOC27 TaxID=2303330 RepID=UPI0015F31D88|nr:MFS transporter [Paraburkholderia sp. DHOC27]